MTAPTKNPGDDDSHPIPKLDVIDVMTKKKDGGADLHIVIAQPLRDDERSHTRLLDKIQNYLGYIGSPEFRTEIGVPSLENTSIVVDLHPDSDVGVRELLSRSRGWVSDSNASLVINDLAPE